MFRKPKPFSQSPEAAHYYEHTTKHIERSIDRLGLDHDKLIVVGSAALTLCHIGYPGRTPRDVDIVVPAQTIVELFHNNLVTPSGVELRKRNLTDEHYNILTANKEPGYLAVDLITRYRPDVDGTVEEYDQHFHEDIDHFRLPSSGLLVASPDSMLREYTRRKGNSKARQDRKILSQGLREMRR